jgi:hypothetical protein
MPLLESEHRSGSTNRLAVPTLIGAAGLLTLPSLLVGYGMDEDAWAGARAAVRLATTGVYHPSRLPGNPLFEYLLALLIPLGGHLASNLFVLASYGLLVAAFARLARDRREPVLLTALFALTPIVLVNASSTMDYLPGIALMLLAWLAAAKRRPAAAGLMMGLSIGFRLSNLLFLLPLELYLLLRREGVRRAAGTAMLSLGIGALCYLPIYHQVGMRMFEVPGSVYSPKMLLLRTVYNGLMLFGPIATAGLLVLLALDARKIVPSIRSQLNDRDPDLVLELTAVALFLGLFAIHSDEIAYLLFIVPFLYLLIARWFSRRHLQWLAALVLSYALFSIDFKGGESGRRPGLIRSMNRSVGRIGAQRPRP